MYVIDDPIPTKTEKWRIKIPRNVMKRFLGTDHEYLAELAVNFPKFLNVIGHVKPYFTDRFEPALTDNEKAEMRDIIIGRKIVPIQVELPATRRAD